MSDPKSTFGANVWPCIRALTTIAPAQPPANRSRRQEPRRGEWPIVMGAVLLVESYRSRVARQPAAAIVADVRVRRSREYSSLARVGALGNHAASLGGAAATASSALLRIAAAAAGDARNSMKRLATSGCAAAVPMPAANR